jgi:hypothetical protein
MLKPRKRKHSKALASAVLVTLSNFVPVPPVRTVRAATASISVAGSWITGVKIAPGLNVKIGNIVATGPNGSVIISPGGVVGPSKGVTAGGAPQAGSFLFTAVNSAGPIDVTVKGMGPLTLVATPGGGGPIGTAKIGKVIIGGIGAAPLNVTDGGGGTGTAKNYALTTKNGPMEIGVQITWGAVQPIGSFTQQIVMIARF